MQNDVMLTWESWWPDPMEVVRVTTYGSRGETPFAIRVEEFHHGMRFPSMVVTDTLWDDDAVPAP